MKERLSYHYTEDYWQKVVEALNNYGTNKGKLVRVSKSFLYDSISDHFNYSKYDFSQTQISGAFNPNRKATLSTMLLIHRFVSENLEDIVDIDFSTRKGEGEYYISLEAKEENSFTSNSFHRIINTIEGYPIQQIMDAISTANDTVYFYNSWIPSFSLFTPSLKIAAKRNIKIKILLLDPSSKFHAQRDKELNNELGYSQKMTENNITEITSFDKRLKECIQLRLTKEQFTYEIYGNENEFLTTLFFKHKVALENIYLQLTNTNSEGSYNEYMEEFELIWKRSRKIEVL